MGLSSEFAERVYDLVELIPRGQVLTYGRIAAVLGEGGPRNVGQAMALSGGLPWWRVVRADGGPPRCHDGDAIWHYRDEQTPMRAGGSRIDIGRALWEGPFDIDK